MKVKRTNQSDNQTDLKDTCYLCVPIECFEDDTCLYLDNHSDHKDTRTDLIRGLEQPQTAVVRPHIVRS